jgi:tellurite resistance protein
MFLAELPTEETEAFLELASMMALIDGNLSIYENSIIEKYKKEIGLEKYQTQGLTLEEILGKFTNERSKNIVLTEILRLVYSDGIFQDQEVESIRLIKSYFGFNADEYGTYKDWIGKIKELSNYQES